MPVVRSSQQAREACPSGPKPPPQQQKPPSGRASGAEMRGGSSSSHETFRVLLEHFSQRRAGRHELEVRELAEALPRASPFETRLDPQGAEALPELKVVPFVVGRIIIDAVSCRPPNRLSVAQRNHVESQLPVVPGLARLGIGDDLPGLGAPLSVQVGLALEVPVGASHQGIDFGRSAGVQESIGAKFCFGIEIPQGSRGDHGWAFAMTSRMNPLKTSRKMPETRIVVVVPAACRMT